MSKVLSHMKLLTVDGNFNWYISVVHRNLMSVILVFEISRLLAAKTKLGFISCVNLSF